MEGGDVVEGQGAVDALEGGAACGRPFGVGEGYGQDLEGVGGCIY